MSLLHRLQIIALLALNPAKFFQKLNRLDWYRLTLQQWVNDLDIINPHSNQTSKILDIGCATGELSQYLSQSYQYVTGIDNSNDMIQMARQLTTNAHFETADATQLPFKNNTFNRVISASLINIIAEPELMLAEMTRVCKKRGVISVLVPSEHFDNNDLKRLQSHLNINGFSAAALSAWHHTPPKMHKNTLIQLFEAYGLTHVSYSFYLENMLVSLSGTKV